MCILLIVTGYAHAEECGVLRFQSNRSSGISINGNDCKTLPNIALGTVFDVAGKGRLWLKSHSSGSAFQMICQNRTANVIQLEFSDMLTPWLNQAKLKNCSGWIENRLSCDGLLGEKNGLYCVLSFFKSMNGSKEAKIERTTSVKMRAIELSSEPKKLLSKADKKKLLAAINPELKMCKQLHKMKNYIQFSWVVDQSTEKKEIHILSSIGLRHQALSECVQTVVSTFPYPRFQGQETFNLSF